MFKVFYMPGPDDLDWGWFLTEEEAWEFIDGISCDLMGGPCEMCQAEYDVVSEEELNEITKE